jgi:hypothetical protein
MQDIYDCPAYIKRTKMQKIVSIKENGDGTVVCLLSDGTTEVLPKDSKLVVDFLKTT